MNTLKYIFIVIAGVLLFTSCEEDTFRSDIKSGTNLAGFTNSSKIVSNIASGDEYPVEVRMHLTGPSVDDLSGDVNVTVEPDFTGIEQANRAEAGTHFRIDNNQLTLKESDGYMGKFKFTMLTNGITAPKKANLNLKVAQASGAENVTNSGKTVGVQLSYACDSNLQGTYDVQVTRDDGNTYSFTNETVTKLGVGKYQTETVGQFGNPPMNYGVTFFDSCGELTVQQESSTGGYYSNDLLPNGATEVEPDKEDAQDGSHDSFTLKYTVDGYHSYTGVYTKK